MTAECPVIASIDDVDKQFATRAFHGTSFDPEKRGESRRQEYAEHVNGLYAELWSLAKTDDQRAILADEMERYRQGYLSRLNAYLASHSNIVSTMIAGPSGFPADRMNKRNQALRNKVAEWLDWQGRASKAIKAKILDAWPEGEKASAEWLKLRRDIIGNIATIAKIDAGAEFYTRSAFVNSIAGKVERLARNGETELVDKAIECVQSCNAQLPKPAIGPRHKFWAFGELARANAAKRQESASGEPEVIAKSEGVEIIADPAANRVQILFDDKPDSAMIAKLKAQGWRWAPSVGAWQRQMTEAAKYSAKSIVGALQTV